MRTQGILLVKDATLALNTRSIDGKTGLSVSPWVAIYSYHIQVLRGWTINGDHGASSLSP